MKIKQYVAFALMGLALGACKKPGEDGPDSPDPDLGKTGTIKLSFKLPEKIGTYAPGDDDGNATDEETQINYIDVFIYDDGDGFALTYLHIDAAGLTRLGGPTPNVWTIDDPISVRTGQKQVYVGVNLPDHIVDRLKTGHYVNEEFSSVNLANDLDAGGDGTVAFFNTNVGASHIYSVNEGANTSITVDVSRLVAKIVVTTSEELQDALDGNTLAVSGGRISNLEFTVGQRNDLIYVMPLTGLVDPNYENGAAVGQLEDPVNLTLYPYKAVNAYDAAFDLRAASTQKVYAPENTVDGTSGGAQHRDVTYVSIRATFTPDLLDDTGSPAVLGETFYAVFTGNDDDEGLGQRYFEDETEAQDFIDNNPDIAAPEVHEYLNGQCYYRLYLNPTTYNVLRNTVYDATITHINYIGTRTAEILPGSEGSPTHPTFPGGWELSTPVLQDAAILPVERGTIDGSIRMTEWIPAAADYELY